MTIETRHEVRDRAKVAAIAESLERDGWVGAPVVVYDSGVLTAVTGTHRLAACEIAGIQAPTITLAEIFAECGLDLAEIENDCDYDIAQIVNYLPADVAGRYGIEQ